LRRALGDRRAAGSRHVTVMERNEGFSSVQANRVMTATGDELITVVRLAAIGLEVQGNPSE